MVNARKVTLRLSIVLAGLLVLGARGAAQSSGTQRLTLVQAQAKAAAGGPGVDIAALAVDAARYHRKAVEADYFPKLYASFANLHFNKFMGDTFTLARRTRDVPLLTKDETIVAATVTQPVTPLFKVHQAVVIAKADEAIARAKASSQSVQRVAEVERTYFSVLIAQRRQAAAETTVKMIESGLQLASAVTPPIGSMTERYSSFLKAAKDLETINGELALLTRSLNAMVGFPPDTALELEAPEPAAESPSLEEATQQALANSLDVTEAEQTVVKAKAATKLSKLEYVPDVAVMGGYVYEIAVPLLPTDFSFIGVIATWNIFDFGKRERTISERRTELRMAEAAVDAVRAKVAASTQKAFLDLQRARRIRNLSRQLANRMSTVNLDDAKLEAKAAWAQTEADMFQAEMDYRAAYSELKRIMDGR